MARRKVRLAYIINESKRKASYRKRKKGLLKKLNELTVLCSVEVAVIMYSSFEQEPIVWPSVESMQQTIARFQSLPNVEQTRRMINQESFVRKRLQKLEIQHLNLLKDNKEREMNMLLYKILIGEQTIHSLSFVDLNDLGWVTNMNIAEIDSKVEASMNDSSTPTSILAPAPPVVAPVPTLAPFIADAPFTAIPSTAVLGQTFPQNQTSLNSGTMVAPTNSFSPQSYQGNMSMQTPIFPNPNPGLPWNLESWDHFMRMMNNNQNDPAPGGSGTGGSNNP